MEPLTNEPVVDYRNTLSEEESQMGAPTLSQKIDNVQYTFTKDTFNEAMKTYGPENLAQALTQRAGGIVPSEFSFTLEDLRSGDSQRAPILAQMPTTKEMTPEQIRNYFANPEAALSMFSNMEDFGKYDPKRKTSPGLEAAVDAFARFLPQGVGMSEGALIGGRAMKKYADRIQPKSPPQALAKLGLYGVGILPGLFIGQQLGEEVSDYALGEAIPVAPSLMAYNNFGETAGLTINPSTLSQPFRWTKDMNWLGAKKFLENYKTVTKGGWQNAGRATELTDAASGLSQKAFLSALSAKQGRPFAFGKLGFDKSLGPTGTRVMGGLETAIGSANTRAWASPFVTPALEAIAGGGSAAAAFVAEAAAPGSDGWRFIGEMLGAAAPGPVAAGAVRLGSAGKNRIKDLFLKMKDGDAVGSVKRSIAMDRLYKAMESNPDFTGEDMLNVFLEEIANAPADSKNIPISLFAGSKNSPITRVLQQIDMHLGTVSDELEVATKKGREQFLSNAKSAIMDLKAQGDPEAVQLASLLQKNLFEESLQGEMSSRLDNFYNALDAVTGGDPQALEKYNVSNMLYERLTKFMGDVKEREKVFWDDVGDYELNNFDEENLPAMMTIFDVPYDRNEGGGLKFASETKKAQFWNNLPDGTAKDLKLIFNYFGRNLDGTPIGQETGGTSTSQLSPALSKAYDKFQETADALSGTALATQLRTTEDRAKEIADVGERVAFLRREADEVREVASSVARTGLGDGSGTRDRSLATALDRLATIELLRSREVGDTRLAAGAVDGEELENPLTAKRLFDIRSGLLAAASSLRKNQNPTSGGDQTAASMDRMAESVLNDLLSDDTASEPYNLARAYTLASRDVAERSFLGNFGDVDKKGRQIVTPENALDYVFKRGGSDAVTLRMREMDAARQFIREDMGLSEEAANSQVGDIDASMQSVLQWTISNITKQEPNPANPSEMMTVIDKAKFAAFKAKPENQELLSRFGTIARDLGTVESAQNLVSTLGPEAALFNTSPDVKALNAVIATGEKSGLIAANAINSNEPFKRLQGIISTIKEQQNVVISPDGKITTTSSPRGTILGEDGAEFTQEQALNGLRSSILTYATTRSGNEGLKFDAKTMFDTLFTKLPNMDSRDASLAKFMQQEGLMTKEQVANMRTALKQMINIDEAFQKGNLEEVLFKNPTKAKLLATRGLGAIMGTRGMSQFNNLLKKMGLGSGGNSMGAGLIIARGGAESAQDFFLVAPEAAVNKGMIEIMQNPDLFRELTLEIQNKAQYNASNRVVNQFFANLGVDQTAKRQNLIARPFLMGAEDFDAYEEPKAVTEEVVTPTDFSGMNRSEIRALIGSGEIKTKDDLQKAREALKKLSVPSPKPEIKSQAFVPRFPNDTQFQQDMIKRNQRPSPVAPPTTQASAVPSPAPAPASSGPVDRTRYAALFPNDSISGMMQAAYGGEAKKMRRGGIASLLR